MNAIQRNISALTDFLREDRSRLTAIVAIAIALRLVWALCITVVPLSDSVAYDTFAKNIAEYGVFGWTADSPAAFWPVGTSAVYALLYKIFGSGSYWPLTLFHIAAGVGVVVLSMRVARRFFGDSCANIAGVLMAIWPSHVFYVTVLASELPFTLLLLASIDVWTNPRLSFAKSSIAVGVFTAAACYLRPVALLLPFVFAFSTVLRGRQLRTEAGRVVTVLAVAAVAIAPWTYRNYQLFGHPVLISTNGPITLWMGNHEGTNGSYAELPEWTEEMNEYAVSQELGAQAKEYILADPVGFVGRSFVKLVKQHAYETIAVTWNEGGIEQDIGAWAIFPLKLVTQGYWVLMLGGSLVGLFLMFRESGFLKTVSHPVVAPWIYFSGIHAIILAQDRYHFAVIPLIAALCAFCIDRLLTRYQSSYVYA